MKKLLSLRALRLITLFALLLTTIQPTLADGYFFSNSGIYNYCLYYKGDGQNAVGDYALLRSTAQGTEPSDYTGIIPTSVTLLLDGRYPVTAPVTELRIIPYCDGMTSQTIPNTITTIHNYAGQSAPLKSIIIPNSVTSIGACAFRWSALTSMTLPNSISIINPETFRECRDLASITIPNSVTTIGDNAFDGCSSLTSVTIPNSVTTIGEKAFCGCSSLTSVTIPNSVDSIGVWAFNDCKNLKELVWNAKHCWNCFDADTLERVIIGNEVEVLPGGFAYSSKFTEITIPNSVDSIGGRAFQGCYSLKTVYWNARNCKVAQIEDLNNSVFDGRNVTHLFIGSEVESIDKDMFYYIGTNGDLVVTSYAIVPPTITTWCFNRATYNNAVLEVPAGSLEAYRNAEGWKEFFHIVAIDGETVPGDANGDGQVSISDVMAMINWLLSGSISSENQAKADCDGDGKITITDVTKLINYLLSGKW